MISPFLAQSTTSNGGGLPLPSTTNTKSSTIKDKLGWGFRKIWLRRRKYGCLCFLVIILYIALGTLAHLVLLAKYHLKNSIFDEGWTCDYRKEPMLQVLDTNHVSVVWETSCLMKNMRIQWGLAEDSYKSILVEPVYVDQNHFVYTTKLGPLEEIGNYTYQITSKSGSLRKFSFQYHPANSDQAIRVAAFSDNQFGLGIFNKLAPLIAAHKPNFLVHAGDAVQQVENLQQWQTDFFGPLTQYDLAQTAPMIYARGNHDFEPEGHYVYTHNQTWFSFNTGNTRWIVLDSNLDKSEQDEWLKKELSSEEFRSAKFRIVVVHIPPFMEFWDPVTWEKGEKHWGEFIRLRYSKLMEESGVDLVISGHQHSYQRGFHNNTMYTIIGGAGGELDYERVEDWKMYSKAESQHHYVIIDIYKTTLKWTVYNANNVIIDEYQLESRSLDTSLPTSTAGQVS
ncbi:hypothetical protein K7432_002979 [Basidiobolus ranarum]|uniref:Calcineurin-like phosphoesterase domain-containing protein n=1 Tax=Basidiobolus ranarum TaxID=34480 RepID=A0ABR2X0N0_9FUNG